MRKHIFCLGLIGICIGCSSVSTTEFQIQREAWIQKTIVMLKGFSPSPDYPRVEPSVGLDGAIYSVKGTAFISFPNDDWIYMTTHSIHQADIPGDFSLAIDNQGNVYANKGHVCGGIQFIVKGKAPQTAEEFFMNSAAWIKGWKWKRIQDGGS